jgi:hypothetical protein
MTMTPEEKAAWLLINGFKEDKNTESTVTFFQSPESAAAGKKLADRVNGETPKS